MKHTNETNARTLRRMRTLLTMVVLLGAAMPSLVSPATADMLRCHYDNPNVSNDCLPGVTGNGEGDGDDQDIPCVSTGCGIPCWDLPCPNLPCMQAPCVPCQWDIVPCTSQMVEDALPDGGGGGDPPPPSDEEPDACPSLSIPGEQPRWTLVCHEEVCATVQTSAAECGLAGGKECEEDCGPPPLPNPGGGVPVDPCGLPAMRQGILDDSVTLWTPVLLVNSPHGGSVTSTGGWSDAKSIFSLTGKTSVSGVQTKIETVDGKSEGVFQLATWGHYTVYYTGCGGPSPTDEQYVEVIDWTPNGVVDTASIWTYGGSQRTDADDLTSVAKAAPSDGKTYSSVIFNARYQNPDAALDTQSGGGVTEAATRQDMMHIGGGVSVGGSFWSFDALRIESTTETSAYYEYNFPSGGVWYMDFLGPDSSYARAFCRPGEGVTCT